MNEKYNKKMQLSLYILAGWLLDGSGGPIKKNVYLEVENGRIARIRRGLKRDFTGVDLLDLSDYTLLPGLVDCHVHLSMSGSADSSVRERQLRASFGEAKQMIQKHLSLNLLHGVLALRDGGDRGGHTLRYKKEFLHEGDKGPEVKAAGKAWHAPGRYGRLVGRTPFRDCSLTQSLLKGKKHGDHVKIIHSGLNSLVDFGKETSPQFRLEDLRKAVLWAHGRGLKVMVHANGREPVRDVVDSGCDSIEHGFFMGTENLKRLAEKQITWVPTAFTMEAYVRWLPKGGVERDVARRNLDHQLDQIRQAKDFGVPMAVGTDAGSLGVQHGEAVREEIRLLLIAGLSLSEAVRCATSAGADLLGLEDRGRCLRTGSPATFLAVRSRPETFLEALETPEKVYLKGVLVPSRHREGRQGR